MLTVGKMNKLVVDRIIDMGAFLTSDKGDVLLPRKCLTEEIEEGDVLDVFVFTDDEDRLEATTTQPYAVVDDFATLEVVDLNDIGAFLDWGMDKDLLLPFRRQFKPVVVGRKCVVKLFLDENSGRVTATTKLRSYLKQNDGSMFAGKEVSAVFFDESELGFSAILDDAFLGLLHRPDASERITIGEPCTVYVKRVLPAGQIELSMRKVGYEAVVESSEQMLEALKSADGFLPYTDKSSPEEIKDYFNMSKKAFKRVVGALYKEKKIAIEDDGIRLL